MWLKIFLKGRKAREAVMLTPHYILWVFTHLHPSVTSQPPHMTHRESHPRYTFGECSVLSLPQLPSYSCTASAPLLQIICLSLSFKIQVIPKQEGFVCLDLKLTHACFLISNSTNKNQRNSR